VSISLNPALRGDYADATEAVKKFLHYSRSQLTSYGRTRLLTLTVRNPSSEEPASPPPNSTTPELNSASQLELFALLRNSRVAVLCRHANELYTLVTDHRFLNQPSVVWELLVDTHRGRPIYFDSAFRHVHPDVENFRGHFRDEYRGKEIHRQESKFGEFVNSTIQKGMYSVPSYAAHSFADLVVVSCSPFQFIAGAIMILP
jgi:hypothetical protein